MSTEAPPPQQLALEARAAKIAGSAAVLSAVLTLAGILAKSHDLSKTSGKSGDLHALQLVAKSGGALEVGTWLTVAGLLAVLLVAPFLLSATRLRNPAAQSFAVPLGVLGALVVSVMAVVALYHTRDVAHDFLRGGDQSAQHAKDVLKHAKDHGTLKITGIVSAIGAIAFGIWASLSSFEAMRTGLLPPFVGYFGTAAGLTTAIQLGLVGECLFLAWIGSVGLLALGYFPGGRPDTWETGIPDAPQGGRRIGGANAER